MNAEPLMVAGPVALPPAISDLWACLDQRSRAAVQRLLASLSPQLQAEVCQSLAVLEQQGADVDAILAAIQGRGRAPVADPCVCQPLRALFLAVKEVVAQT